MMVQATRAPRLSTAGLLPQRSHQYTCRNARRTISTSIRPTTSSSPRLLPPQRSVSRPTPSSLGATSCLRTPQKRHTGAAQKASVRAQMRANEAANSYTNQSEISTGTRMMQMIRKGDMPDDMPLFPGTLIFPKYKDFESVGKVELFWKYWDRIRRKGSDFLSLIFAWYGQIGFWRSWQRLPVKRKSMRNTALSLYREMYLALFSNNTQRLSEICCDNTAKQLIPRARQQHATGMHYDWRIVGTPSRPRVVSHKALPYSQVEDGSGYPLIYRQAVIRMHTVHELVPRSKDLAKLAEELDEQKYHEIEEFFVIQKRFYMGKEEPWKIWGTLSGPTKLEEWEQTMRPDPDAQSAGMQAPNMKAG